MGSQLRRLRVKAGVSGGLKGRPVRHRFPDPHLADVAFLDLPKQFAVMSDSEFSDGLETLRAELRKVLEAPFPAIRESDSELANSIDRLVLASAQSRDTIVDDIERVIRAAARRGGL